MAVKRWISGAALALALAAGQAQAQAPPDAEPGFSYCSTYEGVNAATRAFITQVMPGRVTRTDSYFHGDPDGAYTETRMEARLKVSFDAAGIETHLTNPRCEGWPTRKLAEEYRAEMAERWQKDGVPLFEFDYALTGGPVGHFTPYSGKRPQASAPLQSAPSNGPALVVSGPTNAERAERRQELLRQEAEQKAARKRSEQRKAEEVRRQAEARAAFEAWKNTPSKSTPCGGPGQRGCSVSRQ